MAIMQASVGDRIRIHSNAVGIPEHTGEILEARGSDGNPPYMVRFEDGHESLVFPGPDCEVLHHG